MAKELIRVGVVARVVVPVNRWARPGHAPAFVLPDAPDLPPGAPLAAAGDVALRYAGAAEVLLHPGDTGHYRDNLAGGRPSVWVALRAGEALALHAVTVDPYEGESWAGDEGLTVDAVAMPEGLRRRVAAFFGRFHVEQLFEKRKRRPADPEALGRRGVRGPAGGGAP